MQNIPKTFHEKKITRKLICNIMFLTIQLKIVRLQSAFYIGIVQRNNFKQQK